MKFALSMVVPAIFTSPSETLFELLLSPALVPYGKSPKNRRTSGSKLWGMRDCDVDADEGESGMDGVGDASNTVGVKST